jgi:hypothetical protein
MSQIFRARNRAAWQRIAAPDPERRIAPSQSATPRMAKATPEYIQNPERIIIGTKKNRAAPAYCSTSEAGP